MQTEIRPHDLMAGLIEIAMLEEAFGDALKCQMEHSEECTVEVVSRGVSCVKGMNFCQSARDIHLWRMENGWSCSHCRKYARDCWRIVPI